MSHFVVIFLITRDLREVLMLKRLKDPFKGLFNGIGGLVKASETVYQVAYRECCEEIGEENTPVNLTWLVKINLPSAVTLDIFYALVDKFKLPDCNEGELKWVKVSDAKQIDNENIAGDGEIPYCLKFIENIYKERGNT